MTCEEGYRLAQYQRPGVKIIMGPTEAREEWIEPLSPYEIWKQHERRNEAHALLPIKRGGVGRAG